MAFQNGIKFRSLIEFWEFLPEDEHEITEVLYQIAIQYLPRDYIVRLSYNVPYFYLNRRVCFIWPGSIPWGGFKKGVMFGFCYGSALPDKEQFLTHGTNKQVYYNIYHTVEQIEEIKLQCLLNEAIMVDGEFGKKTN